MSSQSELFKNQLIHIMADGSDNLTRLLAYLEYRWDGALWYPVPEGEEDMWPGRGPETEAGTARRILRDPRLSCYDMSVWLTQLAEHHGLDFKISEEDVDEYRRSIRKD